MSQIRQTRLLEEDLFKNRTKWTEKDWEGKLRNKKVDVDMEINGKGVPEGKEGRVVSRWFIQIPRREGKRTVNNLFAAIFGNNRSDLCSKRSDFSGAIATVSRDSDNRGNRAFVRTKINPRIGSAPLCSALLCSTRRIESPIPPRGISEHVCKHRDEARHCYSRLGFPRLYSSAISRTTPPSSCSAIPIDQHLQRFLRNGTPSCARVLFWENFQDNTLSQEAKNQKKTVPFCTYRAVN